MSLVRSYFAKFAKIAKMMDTMTLFLNVHNKCNMTTQENYHYIFMIHIKLKKNKLK